MSQPVYSGATLVDIKIHREQKTASTLELMEQTRNEEER